MADGEVHIEHAEQKLLHIIKCSILNRSYFALKHCGIRKQQYRFSTYSLYDIIVCIFKRSLVKHILSVLSCCICPFICTSNGTKVHTIQNLQESRSIDMYCQKEGKLAGLPWLFLFHISVPSLKYPCTGCTLLNVLSWSHWHDSTSLMPITFSILIWQIAKWLKAFVLAPSWFNIDGSCRVTISENYDLQIGGSDLSTFPPASI